MKKIFAVLLSLLILSGCGTGSVTTTTTDNFLVVTSFYPVYIFTSNIIKDAKDVSLQNLTETDTGCLHNYTVTPKDMQLLEDADLFVINGAGMETFIKNIPSQLPVCDSSRGIPLIETNGEQNAHIWLSVDNAISQVRNITEGLCTADSKNADIYRKNADEYTEKLTLLDSDIKAAVGNAANKNIITFHEAFPYFAKQYGLNIVTTVHSHAESEPSPAQLTDIIDKIKTHNVAALFTEPQYSADTAELISRETGIPVYRLDPAVTGDMSPDAYENIMRENIEVIKKSL